MVRLERITMQGFKSFVNKTTIPFPEGFNVVAGPNGSGKSNLIDALMFVLGTSSARTIRAQKLQNLIFNGSKNRKPADYCEVSLYLDNSSGTIPGEEKEVKITRRITRSGISMYKLNGRSVTKTKIMDLISNANLSSEGFNIILQGDVMRITEMSPMERREIIDDISGIAEFDEKKDKAGKELEHVENRVRESMIVIAEKQRLVSRLRHEKETAEKYEGLSIELRKSKASFANKRLKEAEEGMKNLEKDISELSEKFSMIDKDFNALESGLESKEKSLQKLGDEIIQKSKNYDLYRKIDALHSEILRKKDKIDMNEREIARLQAMTETSDIAKALPRLNGVYGTVSSLVKIPGKYSTALEVAIGKHTQDIVVSDDEIAATCIKYLRDNRIGRTRFLPLNKIVPRGKKECRHNIIGYAIDLIGFDKKYYSAISYVLGSTIIVKNIDEARRIPNFRIATLDGDLIEISGAMIGGFYRKRARKNYSDDIQKLESENEIIENEIAEIEGHLDKLRGEEKKESADVTNLQTQKSENEKGIEESRIKRKALYEEKLIMQNKIGKLKIDKAKLEAALDNHRIEQEEYKDVKEFYDLPAGDLQERIRKCLIEINNLGPVNMKAIEEYKVLSVEFDEIKKKLDKLLEEKESISRVVQEIEKRRYDKFTETLQEVVKNFSQIYKDMMDGFGQLKLEEENNINSGLIIEASSHGKKILSLDSMSGGEKTVTSLAFLFSLMQHYASPFYVLDEVDAALDKANTKKIVDLVKKYSKQVQFIVITHNDFTIQEADKVFGVSMEDGVSKVFGIELPKE